MPRQPILWILLCAWMLWVELGVSGTTKRDWSMNDAFDTKAACEKELRETVRRLGQRPDTTIVDKMVFHRTRDTTGRDVTLIATHRLSSRHCRSSGAERLNFPMRVTYAQYLCPKGAHHEPLASRGGDHPLRVGSVDSLGETLEFYRADWLPMGCVWGV